MLDLQNTDCDEVAKDERKRVPTEPNTGTQGLFRCAIPERGDQCETRGQACFGTSEQETSDHESGEVLGSCMTSKDNGPQNAVGYVSECEAVTEESDLQVDGQIFAQGKLDHKQRGWVAVGTRMLEEQKTGVWIQSRTDEKNRYPK
jgi:hypothetical protein